MASRVTLKDIAVRTGLSVSSVSLALRGDQRFPKITLDRVREAARELGYIYNQSAADLRASRNHTIAVCLGDLSNPIFNDMLITAEKEIQRRGKRLLLGITRESRERQEDFLRQALQIGCEALILCPAYGTTKEDLDAVLCHQSKLIIPTCLISRSVDGFPAPQIVSDEYEAGRLSAGAAIAAGHRNLYWLGGGQMTSSARLRQKGALEEIARSGLSPTAIINGSTSRAFGFDAATKILSENPLEELAFLCFSDLIALGVLSACHASGQEAGQDVSVIGCDDMDEVKYAVPPLATIHIDLEQIVSKAIEAAFDGDNTGITAFRPEFVMRSSLRSKTG